MIMKPNEKKTRRDFLKLLAAGSGILVFPVGALSSSGGSRPDQGPYWAYAVDTTRCIGCCACMRAWVAA